MQLGCHPVAVHIYTQTVHTRTQITNRTTQITTHLEECGPCPVFASFTLAYALQLRKKHGKNLSQGKTSVRVKTSVRIKTSLREQWTVTAAQQHTQNALLRFHCNNGHANAL